MYIKTVIPDVPYYDRLFTDLGMVAELHNFSEHEQFTLELSHRWSASSPLTKESVYHIGAERPLVERVLEITNQGGRSVRFWQTASLEASG